MLAPLLRSAALLSLALALAGPAAAQSVPKAGKDYKDSVDLGFSIKMPEWDFIPPQPGDINSIGKDSKGRENYIVDYKGMNLMDEARVELLKFDRRPKPEDKAAEGDGAKIVFVGKRDIGEWLKDLSGTWKQAEKKDAKVGGLAATRYVYFRNGGSKGEPFSRKFPEPLLDSLRHRGAAW